MCSSYESNIYDKRIIGRFEDQSHPQIPLNKTKRPTDKAVVSDINNKLQIMTWGIPQPWRDKNNARPIINARIETLAEKKAFRSIINQRCLVPAIAWFEWRRFGCQKLKNRIAIEGQLPFTFAGLAIEDHFAIITCDAMPQIAHIHKRMPLVITPNNENKWLDIQAPFESIAKSLISQRNFSLVFDEEKPSQFDLFT